MQLARHGEVVITTALTHGFDNSSEICKTIGSMGFARNASADPADLESCNRGIQNKLNVHQYKKASFATVGRPSSVFPYQQNKNSISSCDHHAGNV